MSHYKSQKFKDLAGCFAAMLFAVGCLVAATYHTNIILELKHHGLTENARVVGIKRGARNSSWAIYEYVPMNGQKTIAQDQFQQYIKRVHKDEFVQVLYHRRDAQMVTADLGAWIWQAPVIFFSGFLVLTLLAILIWRKRTP